MYAYTYAHTYCMHVYTHVYRENALGLLSYTHIAPAVCAVHAEVTRR
jgi:hypothetical protein